MGLYVLNKFLASVVVVTMCFAFKTTHGVGSIDAESNASKFDRGIGVKRSEDEPETVEVCEDKFPNCIETKGICKLYDNGETECICPDYAIYEKEMGCRVREEACDTNFPLCIGTKGTCEIAGDEEFFCNCPVHTLYEAEIGCRVTDDFCRWKTINCQETKGYCIYTIEGEIECKCPQDAIYNEKNGCEIDHCIKCEGITGVKTCTDKFNENVQCECEDSAKSVDETSRECKVDHCEKCEGITGVKNCTDNFNENVQCECEDPAMSFDEATRECRVDHCKKCEGGTGVKTCTDNFNENVQCECEDSDKAFDGTAGECREQCSVEATCENGGTCTKRTDGNSFCDCLRGTTGNFCVTVIDCDDDGRFEKCRDDKGECKYMVDKKRAACICLEDHQKFYDKVMHCEDSCVKAGEVDSCPQRKICNEDGFCACKKGYEGNECEAVIGCDGDLKARCEKINAVCDYDEDEEKPTCKCKQEGFIFDGTDCLNPGRDTCIHYSWKVDWKTAVEVCAGRNARLPCYKSRKEMEYVTKSFELPELDSAEIALWLSSTNCESDQKLEPCLSVHIRRNGANMWHYFQHSCDENHPFICCSRNESDPCAEGLCRNGGTCVMYRNTPKCICKFPFSGDKCEVEGSVDPKNGNVITWILCSVIILLVLFNSCFAVCRCRNGFGRKQNDSC